MGIGLVQYYGVYVFVFLVAVLAAVVTRSSTVTLPLERKPAAANPTDGSASGAAPQVRSVALDPLSQTLATGSGDGRAKLWNIRNINSGTWKRKTS